MNKRLSALLVLISILVAACNAPGAAPTPVSSTDTPIPTAAEAVDVATFTPIPVPTLTSVPSPSIPMASASGQAVNCRSGPALGWDVITLIQAGQSAEIVAKNADASWVEVKNPAIVGGLCWMSASVVTISGDLSRVPMVVAPPMPTGLPTYIASTVSNVSISLSKTTINGCGGSVDLTIYATIWVNGPVRLRWHFETEQRGKLGSHVLILSKATGKDVSDTFVTKPVAGKYWVKLVIEGEDLSDMDSEVTYKINC